MAINADYYEQSGKVSRGKHNITRRDYLCNTLQYAKRGNDLPHAKVNPDIVRKIRIAAEAGATSKSLAAEYGVHYRTIEKIRSYETWRHV